MYTVEPLTNDHPSHTRASINHGRNMDETWTIHGQLASSLAAQRLRHALSRKRCAARSIGVHGTLMYLNLIFMNCYPHTISKLSAKYQFCAIRTTGNRDVYPWIVHVSSMFRPWFILAPHTTTFRVTDSGFCSYTNPSRATIPLIRPHQCDSEGGRIRGVLLY